MLASILAVVLASGSPASAESAAMAWAIRGLDRAGEATAGPGAAPAKAERLDVVGLP
jgi:hypothetical protein